MPRWIAILSLLLLLLTSTLSLGGCATNRSNGSRVQGGEPEVWRGGYGNIYIYRF